MRRALVAASPSVLSSAFTTMAGLLMLCFMKFRIGMDLGIVLAKGVLCSVLCIYTILPALVLLFHNAIWRSRKRVPVPNTDRLARFELRFRIPLALVAVVVFVASLYLHNLTTISFSTNWPTTISEVFPRKNTVVLAVSEGVRHRDGTLLCEAAAEAAENANAAQSSRAKNTILFPNTGITVLLKI